MCNSPLTRRRKRVLERCETRFLCVYASVSVLGKPDRIEFSLASSDLSICLLFSYSHILIFLNVLWDVQQVYYSLCPAGSYVCIYPPNYTLHNYVLIESLSKSSLPNIFVSFLFVDEYVNRFSSSFLSFKKSFRSSSSVKKMLLTTIMTNYSSTKLTLLQTHTDRSSTDTHRQIIYRHTQTNNLQTHRQIIYRHTQSDHLQTHTDRSSTDTHRQIIYRHTQTDHLQTHTDRSSTDTQSDHLQTRGVTIHRYGSIHRYNVDTKHRCLA